MYKITKAINKFRDELDVFDESEAADLTSTFLSGLIARAMELDEPLTIEEDPTVNVTVEKAGPYASAEFKLPVKDFDKLIDQIKTI